MENSDNTNRPPCMLASERYSGVEPVPARNPFLCRVLTVAGVTISAGILLALLILGIEVLLAAFAGVLIAVLLSALSDFVESHTPLSYGWALALVVIVLLLVAGGIGWSLAPQVAEQTSELGTQLTKVAEDIEGYMREHAWGKWILDQVLARPPTGLAMGDAGAGVSVLSKWGSHVLVAVFVGLFAAADPRLYRNGISHLFFIRHRPRVCHLMREIGYTLRWWLIGQSISMVIIGVSTMLLLWAFGMPLPVVFGLIVGILGFVPYIGPLLGAIPIALIATTQGAMMLLYIMLAYIAVQMIEGYVITPMIQHQTVYLPPVFTIITQVLFGVVLGPLGFILATPLAAVVLVLTRFYRADMLGDPEASKQFATEPEKHEKAESTGE